MAINRNVSVKFIRATIFAALLFVLTAMVPTGFAASHVAPSITVQPASQSITSGQSATFSVTAAGTGPLSYEWKKNGSLIWGAFSSSYTVSSATLSQSGTLYSVTIINRVGRVTSGNAALTVAAAAPAAVAPSMTAQPTSVSVTAGQSATFSASANGTAPMSYQWTRNQAAISGATSSSYQTPATATTDNGSQFAVVIANAAGSVTSNAATLTVNPAVIAPSITSQPVSQSVNTGTMATFNVATMGTAPMTYQWQKNNTAIARATSSTYQTPATVASDNGSQFSVVISNSAGAVTSTTATLTVVTPVVAPSITSQPVSQAVNVGQGATFSVTATGTAPFTYQWRKNQTAISGATSSFYVTPATASSDNNSQFSVVVSNSAGAVTSTSATLTLNTAATLLLIPSPSQVSFGSVTVSSTGTQTVTVMNTGNSSVTISNVSVSGAGFNAGGGSTGLILTAGQTASVTVTFAPSAAGNATGSITVASNATNSPSTVGLSGTGVAQQNSVYLSWTGSTSSVTGYNVYSSTVLGGPYAKLTSTPNPGTNYTDSTIQPNQTYYYVTTAVDSTGDESAYSAPVTAIIP